MIYKSDIKVVDVAQKLDGLRNNGRPLIIFGTGNYGALALHALTKQEIGVNYFCDNNKANWGTQFCGYRIISPDQLLNSYSDAAVIIASLRFKNMAYQLRKSQNIRIFNCDFLFSKIDLSGIEASTSIERLIWMLDLYMFAVDAAQDKDKIKIKSLDIVVTEKCSLRCRSCSNLMQYYQKPRDNDIDLLLASLERFMTNVDELYEARIIGGEPFMYKDHHLARIIKKLSDYENCRKITIFTNGTIIPKKETWESLKCRKVSLIISDYGKLSKNISGLKALLSQSRIPFIVYDIDSWQDCATVAYRQRTEDELIAMFGDCCVNDALTLLHGRLYTCPFSAHIHNLKAIPPEQYGDQLDLIGSKDCLIKEKILSLYSGKKYLNACSFCAGRDYGAGRIEVAVQAALPLPLKTYETEDQTVIP